MVLHGNFYRTANVFESGSIIWQFFKELVRCARPSHLCLRSLLSVLLWCPVGFIDVPLLINNAEHHFKCLSDHFISLNKCLFKFSVFKIACWVSFSFFLFFLGYKSIHISPLFTHKTWKCLLRCVLSFHPPEEMSTNFPCEELYSIFPWWSCFGGSPPGNLNLTQSPHHGRSQSWWLPVSLRSSWALVALSKKW